MSFKLFAFVVTLTVVCTNWSPVNACKCRVLPDPGYCRTGYVALVKITGKSLTTCCHCNLFEENVLFTKYIYYRCPSG